ncbi:MAG: YwaF family protein [Firmicutes bacterium]|nr:YwaF family protein [Bacillota bacterium]
MDYFFYYTKIIEEKMLFDIGFDLYCPGHLVWLAATVVACVLFSNWYKKLSDAKKTTTKKFFAVAILISEILKDLVLWLAGAPMIEYLPLHLCSFAIFGMLIDAFGRWQHITGQMFAYAFCPGAVSALLFCNWTELPFFNYLNIHSFVFHAWIVIYFVMLYRGGEIKPAYSGIWKSIGAILPISFPIIAFNLTFDQNYLFLNEASEGSPLVPVWNIFGTSFGLPGYIFGVVLLVLVVFHVLYVVYKVLGNVSNKKRG